MSALADTKVEGEFGFDEHSKPHALVRPAGTVQAVWPIALPVDVNPYFDGLLWIANRSGA